MDLRRYNQGGLIVLILALVVMVPVTWIVSRTYSKPVESPGAAVWIPCPGEKP